MSACADLKALRSKVVWLASVVLGALLASGCAADGPSRQVALTLSPEVEAEADALVQAALDRGGYPGMTVIIARDGVGLYEKGFGFADLERAEPVTAQTVFPIGSVTKSFTALAVARLAVEGKIDLDASIADYVEDLPDGWGEIKVRNLLNHTAGIFDYTSDRKIQAAPGAAYDFAGMRAFWEPVPLAFAPGSQWDYSNSGYYLLGKIVEKASGLSYARYLEENVFQPFGLQHTSYPQTIEGKQAAKGYEIVDGATRLAPEWSPSIPFAAGALLSTVGDLAKYGEAVHHSGLISERVRQILYTRDLIAGERISYALGGLNIQQIEGRLQYAHIGSIWGYTSYFAHYPEESITIAILTNGDDAPVHPSNLERKLSRLAFGEPQPAFSEAELSPGVSAAIEGDYSTAPMKFVSSTIGFEERGGKNFMVFGGSDSEIFSFPLRYVGDGKFIAYHDDELTVQFDDIAVKATRAEFVLYGGLLVAKR